MPESRPTCCSPGGWPAGRMVGWRCGWVYLIFSQLVQWIVLARESAAKVAELLVLRHEVTVLRRQVHRTRVDWADRALLAGSVRVIPRQIRDAMIVRP